MAPAPDQVSTNRRGCYFIGGIVLLVVVLFAAIGLGVFGDVDLAKITGLPVMSGAG